MSAMTAIMDQAITRLALMVQPLQARWNSLESGQRRLLQIGTTLLVLGILLAFVWLPAVRTRDALTVRLPQLEALLAGMRNQAKELKTLANQPAVPMAMRSAADVAALQSIFGPDARIMAEVDGFRIVIAAVEYAAWWDKTNEALSRHTLALRTTTLTRVESPNATGHVVAVDMRLGRLDVTARAAVPATPPARQDK